MTLGFFFVLILMAYIADCLRRKTVRAREDDKYGHDGVENGKTTAGTSRVATLDCVTFYQTLLPIGGG